MIDKSFDLIKADRIDRSEDGMLNEVVVFGAKRIHIERMDTGRYWMRIERVDAPPIVIEFDSEHQIEATARVGD